MRRWVAVLLLCCCSLAWSQDSPQDSPSSECVDSARWKRLNQILHELGEKSQTCEASLQTANSDLQTLNDQLATLRQQSQTESQEAAAAEISSAKVSESLQKATTAPANDWIVIAGVGIGALGLGLLLGAIFL